MKTLQKLCAAALLILAVAVSAFASDGQVDCPGITSTPPPSASATTGQVNCPGVAEALLLTMEALFLLA